LFNRPSFDGLAWTALTYFLARAILRGDRRAPLWAGLIAGVAFEAKYGIVLWFLGLALGLAATPERPPPDAALVVVWARSLRQSSSRRPIWPGKPRHGWPFLEVTQTIPATI